MTMPSTRAVHVYHNAFEDEMRYVASIIVSSRMPMDEVLDKVYQDTNTIHQPWVKNESVVLSAAVEEAGGCRSTSRGDRINIVEAGGGSIWYEVATFGFDRIVAPI